MVSMIADTITFLALLALASTLIYATLTRPIVFYKEICKVFSVSCRTCVAKTAISPLSAVHQLFSAVLRRYALYMKRHTGVVARKIGPCTAEVGAAKGRERNVEMSGTIKCQDVRRRSYERKKDGRNPR